MKEINQIIHLTKSLDIVKSILSNGFYTSYAKEIFNGKNILIPMISFSNILFRDIGENEVVNYGKYGIVFDRDTIIEKFDLNPVFYVKNKSDLETSFKNNFENSIIPQTLKVAKDFYSECNCEKFTDYIKLKPLNKEVEDLLNTLDKNVNDEFINSLKIIFENYFVNSLKQMLALKPYTVENKSGETKIAYNEREWRKSFFELNFISEITPKGKVNEVYEKWTNTSKPHYTEKYVQKFELSDIKLIYVDNEKEIKGLEKYLKVNFENQSVDITTLTECKEIENAS